VTGFPHRAAAGAQRGVALPAFSRFSPARRRPDLDLLEGRCRTWLVNALREAHRDEPAGFERFLDRRTGLWTLLACASARPDRVEPVCHWIDVLFDLDDLFAHAGPRRVRGLGLPDRPAVIRGRTPTTDAPHVRAPASLRQRFTAEMHPALWSRSSGR